MSKIVERRDFTPTGFRWLGLSRITVRRLSRFALSPPSVMPILCLADSCSTACSGRDQMGGQRSYPLAVMLLTSGAVQCGLVLVLSQHCRPCRRRFWEAARRTSRKGDIDGVAIIAKVLMRVRTLKAFACHHAAHSRTCTPATHQQVIHHHALA